MKKTEKRYTTGQFAALHGINKKTLLWYDSIGLFHPDHVGENGYRYYTAAQSLPLCAILTLRDLEVPIAQIRPFTHAPSSDTLEPLLQQQLASLDQRIAQLQSTRRFITSYLENLKILRETDLSAITLVEKAWAPLVLVPTTRDASYEEDFERICQQTNDYSTRELSSALYGAMVPVESLYEGDYTNYTSLFIQMDAPAKHSCLHTPPKGTYLRAFCQGDWSALPSRYQEIMDYVQEQGIPLTGYAYETTLNEGAAPTPQDSIVCIEIPVNPSYQRKKAP